MTESPLPGRALVSRRAVREIVARAVSSCYGVTALGSGPFDRIRGALGLATPGVKLSTEPHLEVDLHLTLAFGVPVAEVANNVERAVRYAVQQGIGRDLDAVRIHVDGVRLRSPEPSRHAGGHVPAPPATPRAAAPPATTDAEAGS